ncbi:WD40 repeat-like protein [Trametes coccinea BRFM310]|uniref:WD40 repeat-like protein n=1 Tax=Trametes coccinea (strain BRFM310) TaxID=1353009 RepID=A0A1Y2J3Y4_TRAC3|nr:WD40 repeat-like protein [Trametes coccinea BRFM310]
MSKDIDSTAYVEACTLKSGHCDSINALTFSPDGTRLASGGDDCTVMLWDVNRGESLFRILLKSPVSCILWHPIHVNTLIVGCDDGRIFQLQGFTLENMEQHDVRIGVRSEVHCLAYNVDMRYLAIGIGEEVHVTRERHNPDEYGGDLMLPPPGPERESLASEERLRAVSVHFVSNGSQLISSYLSHGIVCYDVKSRKSLWVITPPAATPNIGSSALSSDGSRLAVYNVATGVDLYPLARRKKPIARYPLEKPPISKHRVQVVYIQGDRGIVCGSTDGNVHVWNRASGDLFQILPHDGECHKLVSSAERARYSYIATGTVEKGHSSIIKIWRAKTSESHRIIGESPLTLYIEGEEQGQPTTLTDAVVDFVENVTVWIGLVGLVAMANNHPY